MLSAHNITKQYHNLNVLKNVSINIEDGSFVTIVGASGAGKSTLLHILSALDTPDSGDVAVDNHNILKFNNNKQAAFRNKNFGFVFQFHHLLPEFSALENVCMPLYIANVPKAQALTQGKQILETIGLGHRLEHKPSELSGGEQQRVAIARGIVHQPKYLFADEPTGNLDSINAQNIHFLFKTIQKQFGITLIIVTHNQDLAKLSDITYEMKDGQIINTISNHN